jgi:hypothetical protein
MTWRELIGFLNLNVGLKGIEEMKKVVAQLLKREKCGYF